ncbi:MAG: DUF1572 family protein [Promethearchaeota archaeon]
MNNFELSIGQHFLEYALKRLKYLKNKTERAFNQLQNDDDLFLLLDEESNSIALIMKHMAGNMKSRWTDFLTTDGEKPNRNRPSEFDRKFKVTKTELLEIWEEGWKCVFDTVSSLNPNDLLKEVSIRKEKHTVFEAIERQLSHYSSHVGQIIFLAKHIECKSWECLTIPRDENFYQDELSKEEHSNFPKNR